MGEYGATEVNQFLEVILSDSEFTNNPAIFQLSELGTSVQTDIKSFGRANIYKTNISFTSNFLRIESIDQPAELKPLPVAGFVNLDDVDTSIFNINNGNYSDVVENMGLGYTIWTAKDSSDNWNVFRATSVPGVPFIL